MGNDFTGDQNFMLNYNRQVQDFLKQTPLFHPEEIQFPLSTNRVRIVDAKGRRVKLAGGNWSGGHLCRECVDGLQCRPLRQIAADIKHKFHMNCVRLTYSLQLYFDNSVIKPKYLKANPELIGKTAMEIFDFTVKTLTDVGLMVILNNHTSTSQWCCSNNDGDGLWWSYRYPEYMFFECAEAFAERYKHNPLVIGMDLRNQLRKANGLEATWGDNNPLTDWRRAASICAEKVLKIAPHWLIIVAGLNYQLDLTPIFKHPLKLSVEKKLVYSGHLYSFSWPPSWANFSYEAFKKKLFNSQFFIRGLGYPILLGEFGNNKRDTLWNYLIRYLNETDVDWTYWPIDGFKCDPNEPQKDETYGIFTNDFKNIRNPDIFNDLMTIADPKVKSAPKSKTKQSKAQPSQKVKGNLRREQDNTKIQSGLKQEKEDQRLEKCQQIVEQAIEQEKPIQSKVLQAKPQLLEQREKEAKSIVQKFQAPQQLKNNFSQQISIEQIVSKAQPYKSQIKMIPIKEQEEKREHKKQKKKVFQQN